MENYKINTWKGVVSECKRVILQRYNKDTWIWFKEKLDSTSQENKFDLVKKLSKIIKNNVEGELTEVFDSFNDELAEVGDN